MFVKLGPNFGKRKLTTNTVLGDASYPAVDLFVIKFTCLTDSNHKKPKPRDFTRLTQDKKLSY
jgi:hypothetical protein